GTGLKPSLIVSAGTAGGTRTITDDFVLVNEVPTAGIVIWPLPVVPVGVAVPPTCMPLLGMVRAASVNGPFVVGVNVVSAAIRSLLACVTRYVNVVAGTVLWLVP